MPRSRLFSYLLIVFGALTLIFGVVWLHWPLQANTPATLLNVYPVPPPSSQTCTSVLVPFPYPWSCSSYYARLPSPWDVLPLLPITYFAIGSVAILSALAERFRFKILPLSLSIGLVATDLGSSVGGFGNQGWPINWLVYSELNFSPVYIVVPAFLADWALLSLTAAVGLIWILPYIAKRLRQE